MPLELSVSRTLSSISCTIPDQNSLYQEFLRAILATQCISKLTNWRHLSCARPGELVHPSVRTLCSAASTRRRKNERKSVVKGTSIYHLHRKSWVTCWEIRINFPLQEIFNFLFNIKMTRLAHNSEVTWSLLTQPACFLSKLISKLSKVCISQIAENPEKLVTCLVVCPSYSQAVLLTYLNIILCFVPI